MKVSVKTDKSELYFDDKNTVNMMVELVAPESGQEKRNPISICAVLDRSGSMGGDKIEHLKQSMFRLIDHMTDQDSLSLVFFDDRIDHEAFRKMDSSSKEMMKAKVSALTARGSTDIGSALRKAAESFKSYEGGDGCVERVMLLTDGQANSGAMSMEDFKPIVGGIRKAVSLSCFGYGTGFNEELLKNLSKEGKGGNYFIESPDSVAQVFAIELGGLLTCYAQEIGLRIKPHAGVKVTDVLNDMDVKTDGDGDDQETVIDVGDMFCGENRKILIRLGCDKRDQALPRMSTIADICACFKPLRGDKTLKVEEKTKVKFVKGRDEATKDADRDKDVVEQVAILEAASAQMRAKALADGGDYAGATGVWTSTIDSLRSVGSENAVKYADNMQAMAMDFSANNYSAGGVLSKSITYCSSSTVRGKVSDSFGYLASGADLSSLNLQTRSLVSSFTDVSDAPGTPKMTASTGKTKKAPKSTTSG